MLTKSAWLLSLCLWLCPWAAWADNDAPAQLQHFVQQVQAATGNFSQQTAGRAPQEGSFAFRRPGWFLWETTHPHQQIIASDGKVLRQYDPDLAQVTERPVDAALGASPAAILFGSRPLDTSFDLQALPDSDGLSWLRATPRQSDAGFQHLDIGFRQQQPVQLLLLDAFDQTTRILLNNMVVNPDLPDSHFTPDIPDDVDVVRLQ